MCKQEGDLTPCEGPGCRYTFHVACMYPPHERVIDAPPPSSPPVRALRSRARAGADTGPRFFAARQPPPPQGPLMCLRCEERCKSMMMHRLGVRFGEGGGPEATKKGDLGFPGGFASYSRFQQYRNPLGRALHRGEARFAGASPVQRGADGSPGLPLLRSSADRKFQGRNGEGARARAAAARPHAVPCVERRRDRASPARLRLRPAHQRTIVWSLPGPAAWRCYHPPPPPPLIPPGGPHRPSPIARRSRRA